MKTQRLYHDDGTVRSFDAKVLSVEPGPEPGTVDVCLDRTAFYPTGGGQPHDVGTLDGFPVLDVIEAEELVVHRVRGSLREGTVRGEVDWDRRLDHRQQHTGQHLLSAACLRVAEAATVGFHLGVERCTIDLDREVDEASLARAEAAANDAVLEDTPVEVTWYNAPGDLPPTVRKEAPVEGAIRVVSVRGVDASPCCGTHCERTGQVGPIKVLRCERHRGGVRVEFVCGRRALRDYAARLEALRSLGRTFTTDDLETPARAEALLTEFRAARARADSLEAELRRRVEAELVTRCAEGITLHDLGVGREGWVGKVAPGVASAAGEPVLVTAPDGEGWRIAVAAPVASARPASELLRDLNTILGGRGGGNPQLAQGRVPRSTFEDVERAWSAVSAPGESHA